jgi:hypothetical protein
MQVDELSFTASLPSKAQVICYECLKRNVFYFVHVFLSLLFWNFTVSLRTVDSYSEHGEEKCSWQYPNL